MAHLEVKPKPKSSSWWIWLLLILIVLGVLFYLFKDKLNQGAQAVPKQDSTSMTSDTANAGTQNLASNGPDWKKVNFKSAQLPDADIHDKDIQVSGNKDYTMYSLGENVLFAKDQNTIQPSATQKLQQVSAALNKRFKGASIGVFGSTDSTGTASHNKQLGAERANAVRDWLVKSGGIAESDVSVHSLGESDPVASNGTAAGRKENRNVVIVAYPKSAMARVSK
jgi:outer membrane protein OmpA-like peptidoglycan-associated protein